MIGTREIGEIIATYEKHGWVLRRVLLSAALDKELGSYKTALFGDVPVTRAQIDAAWFSRPPKSGGVAWEIRYLGDIPYALLENIDEADAEFEAALKRVESLLGDTITAKTSGLTSMSP